jgi:hypothetical protein
MKIPANNENKGHPAEKIIRWTFFNSEARTRYYHGDIIRLLDKGISFKTEQQLKPGTNILIKFDPYDHDKKTDAAYPKGMPPCKMGEVITCEEMQIQYSFLYEISVKYLTWYD